MNNIEAKGKITNNGQLKKITHYEEVLDNNIDKLKGTRNNKVKLIEVTTKVGTWNGDEDSQNRMCRTIVALGSMKKGTTVKWKMLDNKIVEVTKENLLEAMVKAGQAQSDLWL